MREELKEFIIMKVKEATNENQPYFFVRGSGIPDLCKSYGYDALELIDELVSEKRLKKGLVKGRLVIYLYKPINKKRLQQMQAEFEQFLKSRK